MTHKAGGLYLTIDDGPSTRFTDFVDFLKVRNIPAVFFNRGDMMAMRPDHVMYGIKQGYIMANHLYSHSRASALSFGQIKDEILKTENILDDLYAQANVKRQGKYIRFPYMDRGMGPNLIEPDSLAPDLKVMHSNMIVKGLGHKERAPSVEEIEKKRGLQDFLKSEGFQALPCEDITQPLFADTELARAMDSQFTFSTSDWALSQRHAGKHGFNTINDLKTLIDAHNNLMAHDTNNIVLVHDQADIFEVTTTLIDYFLQKSFKFLDFDP